MATLPIKAPAKINLYLDILGPLPGGYHELLTLFERISLHDTLVLKDIESGIEVKSDNPLIPCDKRNLAYKAAEAVIKKTGVKKGISIFIEKNIPVSAGLGGGSSDAASVLIGLNRLWKLKFTQDELVNMGKGLGADVPFFIYDVKFGIGRSRGDEIEPLYGIKKGFWHILVNPGVSLSTKSIYGKFDTLYAQKGLTDKPGDVNIYSYLSHLNKIENIQPLVYNRLEEVALNVYPKLEDVREALSAAGGRIVSMSGSGSTFFTILADENEAKRVKKNLKPKRGWKVFLAKTA